MKSLHDRLLSAESMERALLKAKVKERLKVKQELTVKKREVKRKERKQRESKDDKRATTNDDQDDLMTKLRPTTHDIQQH